MQVKMIKDTFSADGGYKRRGSLQQVNDPTGQRWIKKGIAIEVMDNGRETFKRDSEGHAPEREPQEKPKKVLGKEKVVENRVEDLQGYSLEALKEISRSQLLSVAYKLGIEKPFGMKKVDLADAIYSKLNGVKDND